MVLQAVLHGHHQVVTLVLRHLDHHHHHRVPAVPRTHLDLPLPGRGGGPGVNIYGRIEKIGDFIGAK